MEVFFTEKISSAEYTDFFHIHEYADLLLCTDFLPETVHNHKGAHFHLTRGAETIMYLAECRCGEQQKSEQRSANGKLCRYLHKIVYNQGTRTAGVFTLKRSMSF